MKKYVGYIRVSTRKQDKSGLGKDAQEESIKRFVKSNNGKLIDQFKETESGAKKHRPELMKAIDLVKEEDATIVIAKLDRLARNVHFISMLQEEGVKFVACDLPNADEMSINLMAAMAQNERKMIRERTLAALKQAKKRGTKLGAHIPEVKKALDKSRSKGGKTRSQKYMDYAERLENRLREHREKDRFSHQRIADTFVRYNVKTFYDTKNGEKVTWDKHQVRRLCIRLGIS